MNQKEFLPYVFSLVVGAIVVTYLKIGISISQGDFVYPLDDAYIHLTLADHLANFGTWGMNDDTFSSSSSSILYTILLTSIIFVFGKSLYIPLIVNLLSAILIIILLHRFFGQRISKSRQWILYSFVILLVPVGPIIMSGMEHTMQVAINIWFLYASMKFFTSEKLSFDRSFWLMCIAALLAVSIRFEGLFLAVAPCLILLYRRRFSQFFVLCVVFWLPVVLFGLYSISNDGFFFPNSLLIKGDRPDSSFMGLLSFAFSWVKKLIGAPHLLILFCFNLYFLFIHIREKRSIKDESVFIMTSVISVLIVHLSFAQTGWFYRYEAYLMVFLLISLISYGQLSPVLFQNKLIVTCYRCAIVISMAILMFRGGRAYIRIPIAIKNIHDQQYQMARFLNDHYPNGRVGANDIGAIAYFNEIRLTDLYGLGNKEIVDLRLNDQYDKQHIEMITDKGGVEIVMIYDLWFPDRIPDSWQKIGTWKIHNNYVCGSDEVSFYSTGRDHRQKLSQSLKSFSDKLPSDVVEFGPYTSQVN